MRKLHSNGSTAPAGRNNRLNDLLINLRLIMPQRIHGRRYSLSREELGKCQCDHRPIRIFLKPSPWSTLRTAKGYEIPQMLGHRRNSGFRKMKSAMRGRRIQSYARSDFLNGLRWTPWRMDRSLFALGKARNDGWITLRETWAIPFAVFVYYRPKSRSSRF